MYMLKVQEFLRDHNNNETNNKLKLLTEQYGIKVKEYKDFVGLNYDQIKSPKTHPITIECRSLKLHRENWNIASRAFDRFFNYGEAPEQYSKFKMKHAVVLEKADGSLIPVWFNTIDKRWEISSR